MAKHSEVDFVNHVFEFNRFYDKHKTMCDEIAGVKKRVWYEGGEERQMTIGRSNFLYAIKRLSAFVIDNIHYLRESNKREFIASEISNLEKKYLEDVQYHRIRQKEAKAGVSSLTLQERAEFNKMYLKYITECFNIAHTMNRYLQHSLMISPADIKKNVNFHDDSQFFTNLARYRDEMSNDIANFSFISVLSHFKKTVAYHYTYRIMVPKKELIEVDTLINLLFSYIMSNRVLSLHAAANMRALQDDEEKEAKEKGQLIQSCLAEIYKMTNESLSSKNILPKTTGEILVDKTLI